MTRICAAFWKVCEAVPRHQRVAGRFRLVQRGIAPDFSTCSDDRLDADRHPVRPGRSDAQFAGLSVGCNEGMVATAWSVDCYGRCADTGSPRGFSGRQRSSDIVRGVGLGGCFADAGSRGFQHSIGRRVLRSLGTQTGHSRRPAPCVRESMRVLFGHWKRGKYPGDFAVQRLEELASVSCSLPALIFPIPRLGSTSAG